MSIQRNISGYLSKLTADFPVLALVGARQTGKTTLAKELGVDWLYVDLERGTDYDRIASDPEFFFQQNSGHVIFDEAQLMPDLFALLRSVVDEDRKTKGRFILTGSSSPALLKNISETLAGRVAVIELGTLKANEYYEKPLSPFYEIFRGPLSRDNISILMPQLSPVEVELFWLKGGYPEPILGSDDFYHEWMIDYFSAYVHRDVAALFPKLDKVAYRRFISMLGKLSSKIINKSDLARSIGVSQPTITDYLDIASGTFIWRQLNSFEQSINKRVMKMPRGHIRDSGMLHHLLHLRTIDQLRNDPIAGFSFESFVIEEILKGIQDSGIRGVESSYYRTHTGAEVDLILEGSFGVLPIEIKYGCSVKRAQLRHLNDFVEKHELPFGILINQSSKMEWLTPNILQVPAGLL